MSYERVLQAIERMEKRWKYDLTAAEAADHTFGRIPSDGRRVLLWSVPRSTGEFLRFLVELTGAKTILELGCSVGYSILFLAKGVESTGGHVYTTEILPAKIALARKHFRMAGLSSRITLVEGDILETLRRWKRTADLVFIDADKERYPQYVEELFPRLRKGGLLVFDNALHVHLSDGRLVPSVKVRPLIRALARDPRFQSTCLDMDNGILLARKR